MKTTTLPIYYDANKNFDYKPLLNIVDTKTPITILELFFILRLSKKECCHLDNGIHEKVTISLTKARWLLLLLKLEVCE